MTAKNVSAVVWALLVLGSSCSSFAQGTAFKYHGRLNNGAAPANGQFDLRFVAYTAEIGGNQIGPILTNQANAVAGLFVVPLDFGAAVFDGGERWLEIAVRPTGSSTFTTLNPRQLITPSPYAIFATKAANAATAESLGSGAGVASLNNLRDNVTLAAGSNVTIMPSNNTLRIASIPDGTGPWSLNGSSAFYNAGNVGIGITTPAGGLHVKKEPIPPGGTLALEGTTHTYLSLFPDGGAAGRKGFLGFASATTADITIANEFAGGRIVLANPAGSVYATGGEENLRIVRGVVAANGVAVAGSGFTSTRLGNGFYQITFNPAFAGFPAVTVTSEYGSGTGAPITYLAGGVTTSMFRVEIWSSENFATDRPFHFIAIGPR